MLLWLHSVISLTLGSRVERPQLWKEMKQAEDGLSCTPDEKTRSPDQIWDYRTCS